MSPLEPLGAPRPVHIAATDVAPVWPPFAARRNGHSPEERTSQRLPEESFSKNLAENSHTGEVAAHRVVMASIERYNLKSGELRYRVRYRKPDNKSTDKGGFRTKSDAKQWLHEMEVSKRVGMFVTPQAMRTPMRLLIEEYIALSVGLARNTIAQRESQARNWLLPKWGEWAVGSVTKQAAEQWVEELRKANAGDETIRKCHQLLVSVMHRAVEQNLINRNPVRGVRLPRAMRNKHPYLTYDEVAELAQSIDPRYQLFVVFLSLTGLRFGEAAALRVESIDLGARLISIEETVTEVKGVIEFGPPKDHERRTVAYPAILDEELRAIVSGRPAGALVFTSPKGHPLRHVTWGRRYWHPTISVVNAARHAAAEEAGVEVRPFPKVTPHDLRHTAASLAVREGASVVAVQRMLGHADAKMTLNTYADLFTSDLTSVATVLNEAATNSTLGSMFLGTAEGAESGSD